MRGFYRDLNMFTHMSPGLYNEKESITPRQGNATAHTANEEGL